MNVTCKTLLCFAKQGLFFLLLLPLSLQAQEVRRGQEDVIVYQRVMQQLDALPADTLFAARVMNAAQAMTGVPYVGGTLEQEPEILTVALARTDCILFVEACLCLAQTSLQKDHTFDSYCHNLRQLRYRNGTTNGYASRIHYTSEWIQQAERLKKADGAPLLQEITRELSPVPLDQKFSYMTTHAAAYSALVKHPEEISGIAATEKQLTQQSYFYIPKAQLKACLDKIQDGDIICFVTKVEGLDISHVALARVTYHCEHDCCPDARGCSNGQREVGFIHASSAAKQVTVDSQTLLSYALSQSNCIGIRVVRF